MSYPTNVTAVAIMLVLAASSAMLGCKSERTGPVPVVISSTTARNDRPTISQPGNAKPLGKSVYFETLPDGRRRVLVDAYVSLREGGFGLECLLCRKGTKEHESIFATDADARMIHMGLLAAGAEPGKPVQFDPEFAPPKGAKINISVQYEEDGKKKVVPAQQWVRSLKTDKEMTQDWVFAGSILWQDPDEPTKDPLYLASADGAYVCVTNVPTAMLDLPINSPKALDDREFVPYTERIPELFSKVVLIFEPAGK
jgi:hypothetical protein